jgi:hypothetical protein
MQVVVRTLQDLKCVRCVDGYAYTPIHRCKEGHMVCPSCLEQKRCPVCFRKLKFIDVVNLEEIRHKLQLCGNSGCKKMIRLDIIAAHERHCDLKEHVCASLLGPEGCLWAGIRKELTGHFLGEHRSMISDGFRYDFLIKNYSQVTEFRATVLMTSFKHLFLAKLEYNGAHKVFFGGVQFVSGAPDIAPKFRYEFEVGKQTRTGKSHYKFMFSTQVHTLSVEYDEHINSDYFCLDKAVGNVFTDIDDTLTVTVILKDVPSLAVGIGSPQATTYGFVPAQYCQRCVRRT